MKLFKTKRKQNTAKGDAKKGIAERLVSCNAKMQVAFAKFMDKRVNHLSVRRRKNIFYAFCFISFLSCAYLVVKPFITGQKSSTIKVETIKFPRDLSKINGPLGNAKAISKEQYNHIHSFRMYMDSLAANASSVYDSLLQRHPGLMDSLKLFEKFYYLQK